MQADTFNAMLARLLQMINSVVILVCSLALMEKSGQGLLLTLNSIAAVQVIFELGFSTVLLQYVAHERVRLNHSLEHGICGERHKLVGIKKIYLIAERWFFFAGLLCGFTLALGGYIFFRSDEMYEWVFPLALLSILVPWCMIQQKYWVILEGLGYVALVVKYRSILYLLSCMLVIVLFACGLGLFAPASSFILIIISTYILRHKTRAIWTTLTKNNQVCEDVPIDSLGVIFKKMMSLQTRVAMSYLSGYFMFQAMTPISYRIAGAEVAAIIGVSVAMILILTGILSGILQVKIPILVEMIGNNDLKNYYSKGEETLRITVYISILLALAGGGVLYILRSNDIFNASERLPDMHTYTLFICAAIAVQVISVKATLTRLFKSEPFMWYSLTVALLSMLICYGASYKENATLIGAGCAAVMIFVALPWASIIYRNEKLRRLNAYHLHTNL